MADTQQTQEPTVIERLRKRLLSAENLLRQDKVPAGSVMMFSGGIRYDLERIYGKNSPLLSDLPTRPFDTKSIANPRAELIKRAEQLRRYIEALEAVPAATNSPLLGKKIFIGHGRSHVWLQLKDFIRDRLRTPCDEFNIEPAAGIPTTERLDAMIADAGFAFIVMTAEEEHADGNVYARPNVIHESGLFQGKLGTRRAIILLENGCSGFSNIAGLTQIRFPNEDLKPALEEIRRVLEREGLI